jgi:hypothetical protein
MKIDKLQIRNFRSHQDTVLPLARLNVIRGLNGYGKSSIQMAIEEAFTGRCAVTDEAGRGADDLIRDGGKEFGIKVEVPGVVIECRRNHAGLTQIVHSKQNHVGKAAMGWIAEHIAPIDALSSVLNSYRFLGMNEKEQKSLLAGALASDPVEIDPKILDILPDAYPGVVKTDIGSAAECDALHKVLFDVRADAKRELKAFGTPEPPEVPEDMPKLGQVSSQIAELEGKKRELVTLRSRNELAVQETNSKKRIAYQEKKNKLETARNILKEMNGWVIETSEELSNLQKQLKRRGEADKLDSQIANLKAQQETLRNERAQLTKPVQTECPHCHRPYDNVVPDHSARLAEIEQEAQKLLEEIQKVQDTRSKLPNFEEIQRKIDRHLMAMPKVDAAEVVVKDYGNLTEPDYSKADTSEMDAEISALDDRIRNGRAIEQRVVRYEEQQKAYQQTQDKREKLEKQIAVLEQLVQYFSDSGPIKAKLIGGKLPAFRDKINRVLARFGFECEFEMDPYVLGIINIGANGEIVGQPLKLKQLSKSEQYRFGVAFQIALAEATEIGFVVIDEADILSSDARQQLTTELLSSNLDQAIVLSTGEPMDDFPDVDDVNFFELEKINGVTAIRNSNVGEVSENV